MSDTLVKWLEADKKIAEIKTQIAALTSEKATYERAADDARIALSDEMAANGVMEDTIEGDLVNYKLYYTTPRISVKADADATPDEYCKLERVPKLKEIKEFLDDGNLVNWASLQPGESKLAYKVVKK